MKKKRTRKPRRKNYYFTSVHEDAIVQYTKSTCNIERTKLYESLIQPALSEMVDKITYTYKFTSLPNIDSLREECKIWLTTILDKYNKDKGSKAFSYFSVITKNWFIHKVKTTSKKMKSEVSFEAAAGEIEEKYLSTTNDYGIKREQTGPIAKASFEESLDNFMKAGAFGETDITDGCSASIMLGKMTKAGTGLCELLLEE